MELSIFLLWVLAVDNITPKKNSYLANLCPYMPFIVCSISISLSLHALIFFCCSLKSFQQKSSQTLPICLVSGLVVLFLRGCSFVSFHLQSVSLPACVRDSVSFRLSPVIHYLALGVRLNSMQRLLLLLWQCPPSGQQLRLTNGMLRPIPHHHPPHPLVIASQLLH